ncbi:hypothetical protein ACLB2K_032246 [Fragaria x ananassa]
MIRNSIDDVEVNESDNESVGQGSHSESSHMPNFRYSHQKMRLVLAEYIASSGQVFTSAQHVRFEKLIQEYVQPGYSGVPLRTIRNDSMSLFTDMKRELIWDLSGFDGTFSFSTNFWSGGDEKLGYSIMDIFREYNIDDKVFNITFDDVTGSDAIIVHV